jgi:sec-independent protein translocase protein TatA
MEGIGIWQLVIVFFILLLIFGSKKIKTLGKDLGESIRGFKDSIDDKSAAPIDAIEKGNDQK